MAAIKHTVVFAPMTYADCNEDSTSGRSPLVGIRGERVGMRLRLELYRGALDGEGVASGHLATGTRQPGIQRRSHGRSVLLFGTPQKQHVE
jgi:hypothetical protein